jgi:hypothetical protein
MRPWESVARLAEPVGASCCRGRLLGWGQVRVPSARLDGARRCGVLPGLRFLRHPEAAGSCRARPGAGGLARAHSSRRSGSFGARIGRGAVMLAVVGFVRRNHVRLPVRAHSAPSAPCPLDVFRLREFAPFLRLASARSLLIQTAARRAAPIRDMARFLVGWRVVAAAPGRAGSARLPACVGIPCDIATKAWPRRLIVSGFVTISSASVQRVHATLGIRGTPGRAGPSLPAAHSAL